MRVVRVDTHYTSSLQYYVFMPANIYSVNDLTKTQCHIVLLDGFLIHKSILYIKINYTTQPVTGQYPQKQTKLSHKQSELELKGHNRSDQAKHRTV